MNTPATNRQGLPHILPLDGLRGMAILLVVSAHYFGFIPFFAFGWSGVDLFFVISGYLITGRLLDSLGKPGYFSNFYRNRILRIFPLYYSTLLVFFIGVHFFIKPATVPLIGFYLLHWKSFFLFTENWVFIRFGMPNASYLLHFWSLAVEEQFYLVWPALIFLLSDSKARLKLFASIIIIVLSARCLLSGLIPPRLNPPFYYFNTFLRMDSFVIGALLRQLHVSKIRIPERLINALLLSALFLIGLSPFVFRDMDTTNPFFATIGYTLTALLFACLLHKSIQFPHSRMARFFTAPVLRSFGKISYGLYVLHFPVLLVFQQRCYDWATVHFGGDPLLLRILSVILCFFISCFISILSYRYFESRFLRLKVHSAASR
jgi:peptidoglycan/LPS O-acetylase OafA/YrhL